MSRSCRTEAAISLPVLSGGQHSFPNPEPRKKTGRSDTFRSDSTMLGGTNLAAFVSMASANLCELLSLERFRHLLGVTRSACFPTLPHHAEGAANCPRGRRS